MENLKSNKKDVKRIVKIVLDCVFYVIIGLLLIFSLSNLTRKTETDIASIFGRGYAQVLSDSMDGDKKDSFSQEDVILLRKVKDGNRDRLLNKIEVGDIITFIGKVGYGNNEQTRLITHRVVAIKDKTFYTQGDLVAKAYPEKEYNTAEGALNDNEYYEGVPFSDVVAIYTGQWRGAGKFMSFIQSPVGFGVIIIIPTAAFFIYQAIILVVNIMKAKQSKDDSQKELDLEAEKERIRAELLAEMQKKEQAEEDSEK